MGSTAYSIGFLDKMAEYEKSAKPWIAMTPEERKATSKADSAYLAQFAKNEPKRVPIDVDYGFKDHWVNMGKRIKRNLKSLGIGAVSAAGVTGVRALENAADLATWIPSTVDSLLFGQLAGVDGGRGFLGRLLGKGHRFADSTVHKLRTWSEKYDYVNRIDGKFNRAIQGAGADAVGTFLGFGGLGGLGRRGLSRLIGPAIGASGAIGSFTNGQQKQLREREAMMRNLPYNYRQYIDPTSTAYNQENAPTLAEFKRYHHPYANLPTSYTGRIRVPWSWRHDASGNPVQFRNYGE